MKKTGMVIDMRDDTTTALGKKTKIVTTISGHYNISLSKGSYQEDFKQILAVNLKDISDKDQHKWIVKLLKHFMRDAGVWHKGTGKAFG